MSLTRVSRLLASPCESKRSSQAEDATLLKLDRGDPDWRFAIGATAEQLRSAVDNARAFLVAKQDRRNIAAGPAPPEAFERFLPRNTQRVRCACA